MFDLDAVRRRDVDPDKPDQPKPPYLAFQTFLAFLNELAAKPLPPQIDRSIMNTKSGTDQANLFSALKFFDLIDDNNIVQQGLKAFVSADELGRKAAITAMFSGHYPNQFDVSSQNGTEKLLLDSFEDDFGYTGDTRRKAMTFFLHGARWAGIEMSPHFPTTRMGSGRSAINRTKRTTKKLSGTAVQVMPKPSPQGHGERVTVLLGDAGTVDVHVQVQWLDLPDKTFIELRRIIKELRDLGTDTAEAEEEDDEEVSTS
jgi:hypothetical protein